MCTQAMRLYRLTFAQASEAIYFLCFIFTFLCALCFSHQKGAKQEGDKKKKREKEREREREREREKVRESVRVK